MTTKDPDTFQILGHVVTEVGDIELCRRGDIFFTSREFRRFDDGRKTRSDVPISPESAREWWALCRRKGAVFGEFPVGAP